MAVVGSISAGTVGDYNLILIKSVMDGAMAIIFTAAYGPGVLLSAASVLVYQGIFTIGGSALAPLMKESGLNELSAAGGVPPSDDSIQPYRGETVQDRELPSGASSCTSVQFTRSGAE